MKSNVFCEQFMNIVNFLLQNISYFMKNVRLRTFFHEKRLLVKGVIKNKNLLSKPLWRIPLKGMVDFLWKKHIVSELMSAQRP